MFEEAEDGVSGRRGSVRSMRYTDLIVMDSNVYDDTSTPPRTERSELRNRHLPLYSWIGWAECTQNYREGALSSHNRCPMIPFQTRNPTAPRPQISNLWRTRSRRDIFAVLVTIFDSEDDVIARDAPSQTAPLLRYSDGSILFEEVSLFMSSEGTPGGVTAVSLV